MKGNAADPACPKLAVKPIGAKISTRIKCKEERVSAELNGPPKAPM